MNTALDTYCIDANVLIQAWQKYYSPKFCPDYWNVLDELGKQNKIFICEDVYGEIKKTEDDLYDWLKKCNIPIKKSSENVIKCLKEIYQNPLHLKLVDNTKNRSLADPWVIAHAMSENAVVVSKEEKITATNTDKVKIPNVCENMNVRCINDFEFIHEIKLKFTCSL